MDCGDDGVETTDVQQCLLLARERSVGQILGRRRRTHGNLDVVTLSQVLPRCGNGVAQRGREGRIENHSPDLSTCFSERADIVDIEVIENCVDLLVEPGFVQEHAVRRRSGCKAARYLDA